MLARRGLWLLAALAALAWSAGDATADFTIVMDNNYNGTAPSGSPPWGTATFTDVGAGQVRLTMTNLLQSSSEFIPDSWFFNFDPARNASTDLTFTFQSGQAAQSISTGINNSEPPGQGGDFDIAFTFETSNNANRFTSGETSVYLITGSGITAASFNTLSQNENNAFVSVFKVQGIPPNGGSGEVAGTVGQPPPPPVVPAPPSVILAGIGVLGFGGLARLRRRFAKTA